MTLQEDEQLNQAKDFRTRALKAHVLYQGAVVGRDPSLRRSFFDPSPSKPYLWRTEIKSGGSVLYKENNLHEIPKPNLTTDRRTESTHTKSTSAPEKTTDRPQDIVERAGKDIRH